MRHLLANIMTYAIALLLLAGAGVFAWSRSCQLLLTTEDQVMPQEGPGDGQWDGWEAFGRESYDRNCANCHGRDGRGWDQYPPVSVAGPLFVQPEGREHLIDVHLYGLTSRRWGAPMPRMSHLHDVEMAAVITYVAKRFGGANGAPIMPEEIAARRGRALSPWEVNERRPTVGRPEAR